MRNKFNFTVLALIISGAFSSFGQVNQESILSSGFSSEIISELILEPAEWSPIPMPGSEWDHLPAALKSAFLSAGEASLEAAYPSLPATLAMEHYLNGNRTRFESIYWSKRTQLATAVMAECFERQGRYLEQIANGIWSIAEETWWVAPAHYSQYDQEALPDVSIHYVDLYAAETGVLFAWTYYLLGEELDDISPEISKRLLYELDRRILSPCLEKEDFHWMGYQGQNLNNWTPWICSNWLACCLLCENNPDRRAAAVYKNMLIIDKFLEPYNADGGCDEGPNYWGRAGGSLFDCLELLDLASGGDISRWDHPLVQNIGRYIYRVHIKDDYYVNFADASALVRPDPSLVYRYGKKIEDDEMMRYASWLNQKQDPVKFLPGMRLGRSLPGIFSTEELSQIEAKITYNAAWFPDLELMVAREKDSKGKGFYLAAKGGFNAESHNHNDVGSFVVYFDGFPVLIDLGVETYTKKTFGPRRYDIWTMQSQYHNLPTINGQMQAPGSEFTSLHVNYSTSSRRDRLTLDLANAYPRSAGVESWIRSMELDKSRSRVLITEKFKLSKISEAVILNLMSSSEPIVNLQKHSIHFLIPDHTGTIIELRYPEEFSVETEVCPTSDPSLARVWGEKVYRIRLKDHGMKKTGSYAYQLIKRK